MGGILIFGLFLRMRRNSFGWLGYLLKSNEADSCSRAIAPHWLSLLSFKMTFFIYSALRSATGCTRMTMEEIFTRRRFYPCETTASFYQHNISWLHSRHTIQTMESRTQSAKETCGRTWKKNSVAMSKVPRKEATQNGWSEATSYFTAISSGNPSQKCATTRFWMPRHHPPHFWVWEEASQEYQSQARPTTKWL